MPDPSSRLPLLVLAGGFSRRMGQDKAGLAWQGTPLLLRVLERLAPISAEAWVSARPGQDLPAGPYHRVDDRHPGEGPLAGLAAGLAAIGGDRLVAVAACDYPHADPALFSALRSAAPGAPVVVPVYGERAHPLMALWRTSAAPACERVLARGARRVRDVLEELGAVEVDAKSLGGVDLEHALLNVNDPETLAELDPGPSSRRRGGRAGESPGQGPGSALPAGEDGSP